MRTVDELPLVGGGSHPQALASHAPTPADMDAIAQPSSAPTLEDSQELQGATSTSRPSTSSAAHPLPNRNRAEMNGHTPAATQARPNGPPAGRPSLSRAKSDFGPRGVPEPPPDSVDEASSVDGHFKIRHGWEDQLNSDEYNNILTSVRT